jgi:hypothetical protein
MQNRQHHEPAPSDIRTPKAAKVESIESTSKAPVPSTQGAGGVKKKKPKKKK